MTTLIAQTGNVMNGGKNANDDDRPLPPPADVPTVLSALRGCSCPDDAVRRPAEEVLGRWENADGRPGYLTSLLSVVSGDAAGGDPVAPDVRLLAAILAKNGVPKVWGRSLEDEERDGNDSNDNNGSAAREDGRRHDGALPQSQSREEEARQLKTARRAERDSVRSALPALLFREPDDRIALHLRLAVANVALFDFPQQWPGLIDDLASVAAGTSPIFASAAAAGALVVPPETARIRAVKALRDVLQSVRHRRMIVKDGMRGGARGLVDLGRLDRLVKRAVEDRRRAHERAANVFGPLAEGALGHARTVLSPAQQQQQPAVALAAGGTGGSIGASSGWLTEATLCVGYLKSMAELLPMMDAKSRGTEIGAFLEQAVMLLEATSSYGLPPPGFTVAVGGFDMDSWTRSVDKMYRSTLLCCVISVVHLPEVFAPYLSRCLRSVVDCMLGMDDAALRAVPVKRIVAQTSFVKSVLTCRLYGPNRKLRRGMDGVDNPILAAIMGQQQAAAAAAMNADGEAGGGGGGGSGQDDPHLSDARNAVATLLGEGPCERLVEVLVTKFILLSDEEVAEWDADPEGRFETDLAERSMTDAETPRHCGGFLLSVMMEREPDRAGRALLDLTAQIYQRSPDDLVGLLHREACYRALQLCRPWMMRGGQRLNLADWWDAEIRPLVQTALGSQHPVPMRALQARAVEVVQAYSSSLREQDFGIAFLAVSNLLAAPDLVTCLCAARCLSHLALLHVKEAEDSPQLAAVREHSVTALGNAFALANRVSSEECLRVTLMLVSSLVEANGTSLEHCLHAIAEQLPPLWERAGDSVPIHSCLVAVLNHLIMKIGYITVENPHVQKVLFPLLDYCTDITAVNRVETLLEDGLKLWLVTLVTSRTSTMGPSLTSMLPRLEAIIQNGLEPHLTLKVLQFNAVLLGSQVVEPLADMLRNVLLDCTACVHASNPKDPDKMEEDERNESDGNSTAKEKGGTLKDCAAALNFSDALLQLYPTIGYSVCFPAVSKVIASLPGRALPVALLEAAFGALGRVLWFRASSLEEIFAEDPEQEKKIAMIVRTWLRVISNSQMTIALNSRMRTILFIDQKGAALSLCAAVCHSEKLSRIVGQTVVQFTRAVQSVESDSKLDADVLVEAACGTTRKVVGDGPPGDSASRMAEIMKADPLLTVNLKDALESAEKAVASATT